jgi:hypothetical protein
VNTQIEILIEEQKELSRKAKSLGLSFPGIWMDYSVKTLEMVREDIKAGLTGCRPDPAGITPSDWKGYERGQQKLRERAANRPILSKSKPTPLIPFSNPNKP